MGTSLGSSIKGKRKIEAAQMKRQVSCNTICIVIFIEIQPMFLVSKL